MVRVGIDPDYKLDSDASDEHKKLVKSLRKANKIDTMSYQTALENIKNSGGLFRILPEEPVTKVRMETRLEDHSNEELKIMMLNLGVKTSKQMNKDQIITSIRKKLSEIEIVDDEAEPGEQSS